MVAPQPPDFEVVTDVFSRAIQLEGDARRRFLDDECAGDVELRREVEQMLTHDDVPVPDLFTDSRILEGRRALDRAAIRLIDDLPDRIGPWRIGSRVSSGDKGSVFRVHHVETSREARLVAVESVADEEVEARVRDSADSLKSLRHEGLVEVLEVGLFDGKDGRRPYLITELLPKKNVTRHCTDQRPEPLERVELVARVADALHQAHDAGLCHRGLFARRVFVGGAAAEEPRPIVDGVGVTAWTDRDLEEPTARTLLTLAPEQAARDASALGPRTDVYALGLLLYDLLTGRPALDVIGRRSRDAIRIVREEEPQPLTRGDRKFPRRLEEAMRTALAKDPADRFDSAAAFASELRDVITFERERPRRVIWRIVLGAITVAAIVAALSLTSVV